jgi:NAD(P)-dependent dehydrogenase (short-subunit alcohol dehydrogenase family)
MPSARRLALVTGARRGIGLGIAQKLAADGCDIAIADIVEPSDAAEAVGAIEALGAKCLYVKADVSDAAARQNLIDQIKAKCGRLNVLVNNAGVAPRVRADILEATEESFDRLVTINLKGPYFLTQLAARYMIEQKKADPTFWGCMVNISSISATVASASRGDYCISKAGIAMSTALWAARLGEFGIPVYEIRPGIIATDMTSAVKEKYDKLIAEGLLIQGRWGLPDDIGKVVAAMARGDLGYSTGSVVHVDGGFHVQRL